MYRANFFLQLFNFFRKLGRFIFHFDLRCDLGNVLRELLTSDVRFHHPRHELSLLEFVNFAQAAENQLLRFALLVAIIYDVRLNFHGNNF